MFFLLYNSKYIIFNSKYESYNFDSKINIINQMNINIFFILIFKLINLNINIIINNKLFLFYTLYLIKNIFYLNNNYYWLNKEVLNFKNTSYFEIIIYLYYIKYILLYNNIYFNKFYKQYKNNKIYKTLYTLLRSPLSDKKSRSQYHFIRNKLYTYIPFWISIKEVLFFFNYFSLDSAIYLINYNHIK
jgi:hypothetical protein